MSEDAATLQAICHGRVQGVGFRVFVQSRASDLGLRGTVRNLPDGTVEVRARGERDRLADLLARLKKGPVFSRVTLVEEIWDLPFQTPEDFRITR